MARASAGAARRPLRRSRPGNPVVLGFFALVLIGTLLLSLPGATSGRSATFIEALFTAASAACITGLTVVDTATFWSPFGHVVIISLVQIGGIGIMVFATALSLIVVRKLSLRTRINAAADVRSLGIDDVKGLVLGVVVTVLAIEAVIAVGMTLVWWLGHGYDFGRAVTEGVFHAIAAFNNSGFSLYTDSLTGFRGDPALIGLFSVAIIIGGLGFPVIAQLRKEFRHPLHWSMNTKLVIYLSAVLIVVGWVAIGFLEWDNPDTVGMLPPADRLLITGFHSINSRTAGFNLVEVDEFRPETLFVMDILMFIGGGPAGTSGGIKVTTFGVLLFIGLTELRGAGAVNIFGKRLSRAVHRQAITIVLLAVAIVASATLVIMRLSDLPLDLVLFEVVSAFSTTGISTGITASLPVAAQLVLVMLMFVGRIGPITVGTTIALRERPILYELPKERPIIG